MTQNIIIAHPKTAEQADVIKAFMEALNIKFEVSTTDENPYDIAFVEKIKKSQKEFESGDFTRVKQEDLQHFLDVE